MSSCLGVHSFSCVERFPTPKVCLALALFFLAFSCFAADWHIPDAAFRFELACESADVGRAIVHPTAADSADLRPVVFNAAGEKAGAYPLHNAPGDPYDLIFDASSKGPFVLYLVLRANSATGSKWIPDGGFLMRSKNLSKATTVTSLDDFQQHWKANATTGASLHKEIRQAFPRHSPGDPYQATLVPGAPTVLHRYSALLRVAEPKLDRIDKLKADHAKAVEQLQAVTLRRDEKAAEVAELKAEDAGKTRIGIAAQQLEKFNKIGVRNAERDAKFLAHASHEVRNNLFEFYTVSAGPSFIVIDGKLLATTQNKSQGSSVHVLRGRRKVKTTMYGAQIALTPGTHRLEYLYVAKGSAHDAILSWRPPAVRNADVMGGGVGSFKWAKVTKSESKEETPLFSWRIAEDLRFQGMPDLTDMAFVVAAPAEDASYSWDFGDGISGDGPSVRHLYLATGDYPVTLTESRDGKTRSITQTVFAHPIWHNLRLIKLGAYDERLGARDFSKQPFLHVWNAFRFIRSIHPEHTGRHAWRANVVRALTARIDEWGPAQKKIPFAIAREAEHYRVNDYEGAKAAYALARESGVLPLAALILDVDGNPEGALNTLASLDQKKTRDKGKVGGPAALKAECLLALDRYDEAVALVPAPEGEGHLASVQRGAALRHIRRLTGEHEHLDHAQGELRKLLNASPWLVLDPTVNLVRIDLRLARGELKQAFHLGNRIQNLQLNEVDKPKVMGKQVEALCAVGLLSEAQVVLDRLHKAYPYSTALAEARAAFHAASRIDNDPSQP
jgi:hypothetical protein